MSEKSGIVPDKAGLVGKILMLVNSEVQLGRLQSFEPLILSAPYLAITGGSTKNPNLELHASGFISVTGQPEPYHPDSLIQKLEKNLCFSPDEAKAIVKMVEGLYRTKSLTAPFSG